jgi:6,7-dimethyl-8-ribityllumazine synthase
MLRPLRKTSGAPVNERFVIVASEYNASYVNAMVSAAHSELKRAGVTDVQVIRVPGAFEIPLVAADIAATAKMSRGLAAIICLGVILRGETVHAALIGEAVTRALMQIQLEYRIPLIHEVLLLENESQAKTRCLGKKHNRGTEAAQTALAMTRVVNCLRR